MDSVDKVELIKESERIRAKVLSYSLRYEERFSKMIGVFLGVKNLENSFLFGNKSSALSFNQKILLLIDIGVLENSKKTMFIKFMEIRNQFMHNNQAINFEACLEFIDGGDKYLLKTYPQKEMTKEKQLELAFDELVFDMLDTAIDVMTIVIRRMEVEMQKIGGEPLID